MDSYNPLNPINPDDWLDLSEDERLALVREYHDCEGIELPNPEMHAIMHVIVENQIALESELPAKSTLNRLMKEGLDRHDAVHAIACVLSEDMFEMMQGRVAQFDQQAYIDSLNKLTARKWLERA